MTSSQPSLARLVRQHAETARLMGVDFVPVYRRSDGGDASSAAPMVEAKPADAPAAAPTAAVTVEVTTPASVAPSAAPAAAAVAAAVRDRARSQKLLDELRARYEADAPHKHFVTAHTNIVFGEGDPCARLMFVGEAPGEEEDRTGRPFVGRAGQLLDKMIVAMGLRREDVYIANVMKTRPPGNATPTLDEARLCAPYLYEQISIIGPQVIVTLGLPATRTLLNTTEAMGKLRGRWAVFNCGGIGAPAEIAVMPTYHPAYLLRNYTLQERAKVWSDLQMVIERLGLPRPAATGGSA
ncbi:MAG: hypothetical protein GIKADHBN_01101 [Phycisphaerales bacterium]|nr:hypothetical protein [Phycisphaerales bacterium]